MNSSLKFFDLLIVVGALLLGFGIWFVPNFSQSKEMKELYAAQREIRANNERIIADARKRAAEADAEARESGLVYIAPLAPAAAPKGNGK